MRAVVKFWQDDNGKVSVVARGMFGDERTMTMNCSYEEFFNGALAYHNEGAMVQNAFHFLSPPEREFLISGITPSEWDDMFCVGDDYQGEEEDVPE